MIPTVEEMAQKMASKAWRMRNLYQILPEDDANGKVVPFVLRAEQESFLENRHSRNFVPKARKLGMSTLIMLDYMDDCLTIPNTHCAHVDFREEDAFKKLDIVKLAWNEGPKHLNPAIAEIWRLIHKNNPLISEAAGVLKWANGSRQEAGTSFMGGTPRKLHCSELGPMSAQAPERARKVKRGSFNSVGAGGAIDVETTMEGVEGTVARDIFDEAVTMVGKDLTRLDWKLHFFPWYGHPSYNLPGAEPRAKETLEYAAEMEVKHGIKLPTSRWAWYEGTKKTQKEDMWTQFPTIAEECIRTVVTGQIFPQMVTVKANGRIRPLTLESKYPIYSFWDIGNDGLSCWVGQFPAREVNWKRFYLTTGQGATHAADLIRRFEGEFGRLITKHFFPHDVDHRDRGYTKTYRQQLAEAGIPNHKIITVPIAGDKWDGINNVRDRIPRMWFDPQCEEKMRDLDGEDLPSGIGCLSGYRTQPKAASGAIRTNPLHDICSHGADAMITYACADDQGFINSNLEMGEKPNKRRAEQDTGGY